MRFPSFRCPRASGALVKAAALASSGFVFIAVLGCASNVPTGDPLADEEFGRRSQSQGPDTWQSPPPATQTSQPPVPPAGVLLRSAHRPHQCQDGNRWIPTGDTYRQGCLRCTCVADETSQRIDCRELRSCRKSGAPRR